MNKHETISKIAREQMGIETLETRKSDSLDFHDVAVWSIENALVAAYDAGRTKRKRREVILTIDQALELLKAGSELIYNPHLSIYSLAGKTLRTGVKDQLFRGGYIHEGRYIDPEENAKRRAEEAGRAAEKRAELAAKGQANKRERLDRWCWQIRQCSTDDQIKAALEKFSLWSSVYSLTEDRTDGE